MAETRQINGVHQSLSRPVTILGAERKLFFFAMCLGAATKNGHRFLTENRIAGKNQALYFGFAKPREAHHDADLYRLYRKVADKIERGGGRNLRVVLDYELKKRIYHDLAKLGPDRASAESKRTVAERQGLQMVRGKIPLPDVRIEYDTPRWTRAEYYYEKQDGSLEQIRNFWPTTIHPTAENLANHKDLGVFFPRTGEFTDANGCSVQFEQFYVGTKAHPLSQYRQIDLGRYVRDHPGACSN